MILPVNVVNSNITSRKIKNKQSFEKKETAKSASKDENAKKAAGFGIALLGLWVVLDNLGEKAIEKISNNKIEDLKIDIPDIKLPEIDIPDIDLDDSKIFGSAEKMVKDTARKIK